MSVHAQISVYIEAHSRLNRLEYNRPFDSISVKPYIKSFVIFIEGTHSHVCHLLLMEVFRFEPCCYTSRSVRSHKRFIHFIGAPIIDGRAAPPHAPTATAAVWATPFLPHQTNSAKLLQISVAAQFCHTRRTQPNCCKLVQRRSFCHTRRTQPNCCKLV